MSIIGGIATSNLSYNPKEKCHILMQFEILKDCAKRNIYKDNLGFGHFIEFAKVSLF